jgi:hypothetical protein
MKGTGLGEEYEKKNSHRLASEEERLQVCYDEKSPCVSNISDSNNKKVTLSIATTESLVIKQTKEQNNSHKGENPHSKKIEELDIEQQILLKDYKGNIIDFIIDNKKSIRVEDLKIYEPIYKCYREKENCDICNNISNIIYINRCNSQNYSNEVWLCTNHWQQHANRKT